MKIVVFSAILSVVSSNIVRPDGINPCYRCSSWDAVGQGFVETGDDCTAYYECWKGLGTGKISGPLRRFCPIGTMVVNEDAVRGAPCGHCDPNVCPACQRGYTTIVMDLDCDYQQMNPPAHYGMDDGTGHIKKIGSCGAGGYFNDTDGVCTCTEVGHGCTNRLHLALENSIEDMSCHKAWVAQAGMPALVYISSYAPPGHTGCGYFSGYNPALGNFPHLTTHTLDGAFAGNWVFKVSFSAWINFVFVDDIRPIFTMGDCTGGSSVYLWVVDGIVTAGIELFVSGTLTKYDLIGPTVNAGEWYHIFLTYDDSLLSANINLYVLDVAADASCSIDLGTCVPSATRDAHGSLTPRGCGFSVCAAPPPFGKGRRKKRVPGVIACCHGSLCETLVGFG